VEYEPEPIDTSHERLPEGIEQLIEILAKNTHDNWAARRRAAGWSYGPRRDDEKKTHPGLVAYDELSESEKDYDRATAVEALKAIMALGYEIRKPGP
jgi:hypothetical protein